MSTKTITCYYETLGVSRTCTNDELKQSYRKLALVWHPDKNQHQIELAEEKFKEINQAYSLLSDPNERKWYDDHREAILRGGKGGAEDGDDKDDINLWAYFNSNCYDGYVDSNEQSFYQVYEEVFENIDREEESNTEANDRHFYAPRFGNSKTEPSDVLKFYSHWKNFVTKKKFASADVYQLSQAPNRQIKRLMEKENQKERSRARQAFNDKVRHLAQFVYTRDRRITEYQQKLVEEQAEKQRLREEREREEDELRKELIKKFKQDKQAEYERDKAAGLYDNFYEEDQDNDSSEPFNCYICEKTFKSSRQLQNHENSNKHKQQLAKAKSSVVTSADDNLTVEEISENTTVQQSTKSKKKKKKSSQKQQQQQQVQKEESDDDDDFVYGMVNKSKKNKNKSKFKNIKVEEDDDEEEEENVNIKQDKNNNSKIEEGDDDDEDEDIEDEELINSMLKNFKIEKSSHKNQNLNDNENDVPLKKSTSKNQNLNNNNNNSLDSDSDNEKEKVNNTPKKIGKAKEKRLQRAEKKQKQEQEQKQKDGGIMICNVCKEEFTTRNKLFQHINQTKHAQAIVETPKSTGKKK
ncbi:DnaJ subfamily A member 5 [Tieghemostelium lacteum]|uniref:DnaJ subfamily A member 5 n=1 Tax=Tieghemostelium lacteum TaxID=361077 RepID=A0A151ZE40_TIELA|nr:DnaJ subfamily A member 5 [Tieghemostelium lacteum]|eukprot:KYQ92154.1 DnaJ subfamily A member 5 [Tieghemostelium lacteum]